MKKTYQKPLVFAEQFALYEHISTGCADTYKHSGEANFSGRSSCSFIASGLTLFLSSSLDSGGNNPCSDFFDDSYDESFEFEVYHGGNSSITPGMMFSS